MPDPLYTAEDRKMIDRMMNDAVDQIANGQSRFRSRFEKPGYYWSMASNAWVPGEPPRQMVKYKLCDCTVCTARTNYGPVAGFGPGVFAYPVGGCPAESIRIGVRREQTQLP